MKITFIAYGTRGDVQPILALALGLKARRHQVRMLAGANFQKWIESKGLETYPARVDIQAVMTSQGGQAWSEQGTNPVRQMRIMQTLLDLHAFTLMEDAWLASHDAEVIVSSFTSDLYAASIAEKTGALHLSTPLQPALLPTRCGGSTTLALLPGRRSFLNYLVGVWFAEPFAWRMMGAHNNRFRREILGLTAQSYAESRARLRQMHILQGISAHVVPPPDDWPATVHTTGYWFLDEDWQPPADLLKFLDAGAPPVYIGFGSMTGSDPQGMLRLVVEAVEQACEQRALGQRALGKRALVQAGWANLKADELPTGMFPLEYAPHHWLFPRVSAAVHHGGAGTTAASLRAGVPTVIVPHMADQPFWGRRVAALGVGPQPIPRPRLSAERLANAIRLAVGDAGMRQRAAELGRRIRAEDGIGTALSIIERVMG
jgi:UDP:flavonoid glycosyltransferase YjiC (YdhE family)